MERAAIIRATHLHGKSSYLFQRALKESVQSRNNFQLFYFYF